uniref:Guanylate cyclase n=1 Tax=Strongyloides venezuelensis TaxID=75913 RepID=A0A0K0FCD2_STRVS
MIIFLIIFKLIIISYCQNNTTITSNKLKIALLLPNENPDLIFWQGFQNSAAASVQAWYYAQENYANLRGINLTFELLLNHCNISDTVGRLHDLIVEKNISAIFGPPCSDSSVVASHLATFYDIPIFLFGTSLFNDMSDMSIYPTVMQVMPNYIDAAKSLAEILLKFKWDRVSLLYMNSDSKLGRCAAFGSQVDYQFSNFYLEISIVYKRLIVNFTQASLNGIVNNINQVSRINIICIDEMEKLRRLMLAFYDNGMNTSDYVFINADVDMDNIVNVEGINAMKDYNLTTDGRDADAFSMYSLMFHFHFSMSGSLPDKYNEIKTNMRNYMKEWPFYCEKECEQYNVSSVYAPYLFDTSLLYFKSLSTALDLYGNNMSFHDIVKNSTLISSSSIGELIGATGQIIIGTNLIRNCRLSFSSYIDQGNNISRWILVFVNNHINVNLSIEYTDPKTTIWATRKGIMPLSIPLCGYSNENCQKTFIEQNPAIFGGIILLSILIIITVTGIIGYMYYLKLKEEEKQNDVWKIKFHTLIRYSDYKSATSIVMSRRSVSSNFSDNSKVKVFDQKEGKHQMFVYNNTPVMGRIHDCLHNIGKKEMTYIRQLRMIDHENVNKLVGFCMDGPVLLSLWNYCSRGCLIEILMNDNLNINIDGFFLYSLIKDTVEGLYAIHRSPIEIHGNLSSKNCLVDERWQVKLSDYGFPFLKAYEQPKTSSEQVWTAPELLRDPDAPPTKASDIYSLSIVMADLVNKNLSFENSDYNGGADEIIYLLKSKTARLIRPVLEPVIEDFNIGFTHLIKDMWAEEPEQRPKIELVRKIVKEMNVGKSKNLMDHMYSLLEDHAASLEQEIQERTKELVEEKKKADILLSRLLPKAIAEKLKSGQQIQPEHFDLVTIFFSDVVSFTVLAGKCTALQVINLMNGLYTIFDSVIDEHDVYKVETIGDAYLCVSGLPERNGHMHVKEVALMSLELLQKIPSFRVNHLPNERIKIRIGMHTGSCVAGVVGLTMPRYCLFGDTVNTASRMESNGKPSHIHMSADANKLLTEKVGGFVTESRGEVVIKGKGVMETFWLLGKIGEVSTDTKNEMSTE